MVSHFLWWPAFEAKLLKIMAPKWIQNQFIYSLLSQPTSYGFLNNFLKITDYGYHNNLIQKEKFGKISKKLQQTIQSPFLNGLCENMDWTKMKNRNIMSIV